MANLDNIFENMGGQFQSDKAAGLNLSILFDLSGDGGGQWNAVIDDGKFDVNKGSIENPTATLSMDADDFEAMSKGDLNPMMAFMSGKIKVDGDLNAVMKFQSLVGM
ncbi:MAG: SCP2 sterol-binding domain-containing protein [Candidatus Promineifilaceae bacterium]|nr:SCP2 sterol-binding domain-containing protein [Candidatus Promineifilaceae bacterium]